MIEVEVHSYLKNFLKQQPSPPWNHHLTMARLVARSIRLQKSAIIQTSTSHQRYCLSYLTPCLLIPETVIIVTSQKNNWDDYNRIIEQLQEQLPYKKSISHTFQEDHLVILTPEEWLDSQLKNYPFPETIPMIFEGVDQLDSLLYSQLQTSLSSLDIEVKLDRRSPYFPRWISFKATLLELLFNRPSFPYDSFLIETELCDTLLKILQSYQGTYFSTFLKNIEDYTAMIIAQPDRSTGQFTLTSIPRNLSAILAPIWKKNPYIFIGNFLDSDASATLYRERIGLSAESLGIKLTVDRNRESLNFYSPERLPFPNTPEYKSALLHHLYSLIHYHPTPTSPIIIIIGDTPLKQIIGSELAGELGSRVKVETLNISKTEILVTGWTFWLKNQEKITPPSLLIIATLPLPSLENPFVAGQVSYYKQNKQDWFRLYLLPTALNQLQKSLLTVRSVQGTVVLLDNRINYRTYGKLVLNSLEPFDQMDELGVY